MVCKPSAAGGWPLLRTVDLATHRVTQSYRPHIDVLLNGRRLHRFELELSLIFDVHALVGVVRDGTLIELGTGSCDLAAPSPWTGIELLGAKPALSCRWSCGSGMESRCFPTTSARSHRRHEGSSYRTGSAS